MIDRQQILEALSALIHEHTSHGGSRHKEGKTGGWSNTIPLLTKNAKTGSFQCTFPTAGYYTVQFGVQAPQTVGSLTVFSAIATITWKVEGNTVVRQVSVNNGVSVSGTGQGVNVIFADNTPDVGQPGQAPYSISVQVSPGARPSQNQPAILLLPNQYETEIAPSTGSVFDIPNNAGVISMEPAAVASDGAVVTQPHYEVIFVSVAQAFKNYVIADGGPQGFLPVPPGATQMFISNLSATDTLIFTPTWGIDG